MGLSAGATDSLVYFGKMYGCVQTMSPQERAELEAWESENLGGSGGLGTSDWPGFEKYIGIPPWVSNPSPISARNPKAIIPSQLRWAVFERDNFTCLHCGTRQDLTCDHIIPESKGGPTTLTNLQTLCKSCNSRKGVRV